MISRASGVERSVLSLRRWAPVLVTIPVVAISAQAPSAPSLDGAAFVERVHTDVSSRAGLGERHRVVDRYARYHLASRGDTLVVTADSVDLAETADGVRRVVDVDAVIGGRWKLVPGAGGALRVVDRPVITTDIADVSDVAAAMDDFLPAPPPDLVALAQTTDSNGRAWRRLADSAGTRRYRWSQHGRGDPSTGLSDLGAGVSATVETSEDVSLAWSAGPRSWIRHIRSTVTTLVGTRTVRASIDQRIVVVRTGVRH